MGRNSTKSKTVNFYCWGRALVIVVCNGQLVAVEDSMCSLSGWLEGQGIFETIRTIDGFPWAMSRHMRRAINSAKKLAMRLPDEELIRSSIDTLLNSESHKTGLLRICFGDDGNWSAAHLEYQRVEAAAKVWTHPNVLPIEGLQAKTFPYAHRIEILDQARSQGYDEALVINKKGNISEGAVSNLLVKIAGQWLTPPLLDGVLPGTMRALVIENFDVSVRSISVTELERIESAFLLSSLRIAQPISSINNHEISQSHEFRAEIEAMALRTSVG
jgi:branched-chain amino acid aminotransferase